MVIRTDCYTKFKDTLTISVEDYINVGVEELRINVGACIKRIVIDEATDRTEEATSGSVNLGDAISGGDNLGDFGAFFCVLSHL